jgi:large subunit ribosomal protein L9
VSAQAGEGGKLFGSVTLQHIADLLQEKGVEVDRRKMHVDEPIKTVGEHTVDIKLHRELTAQVKVTVSAENAEPEQPEPAEPEPAEPEAQTEETEPEEPAEEA